MTEKLPEMDSHYEYRVRIAAGELMGVLCNLGGVQVFARFLPRIKEGIEDNLNRDPLNPAKEQEEAQKELDLVMVRDYAAFIAWYRYTITFLHLL